MAKSVILGYITFMFAIGSNAGPSLNIPPAIALLLIAASIIALLVFKIKYYYVVSGVIVLTMIAMATGHATFTRSSPTNIWIGLSIALVLIAYLAISDKK